MRLLLLLSSILGLCNCNCPKQECDGKIKVWFHISLTDSFKNTSDLILQNLNEEFKRLSLLYDDIEFGVSGFGYRKLKKPDCMIDGVNFNDKAEDDRVALLDYLRTYRITRREDYEGKNPLEDEQDEEEVEDALSGIRFITKYKFNRYYPEWTDKATNELRILIILTDTDPHYIKGGNRFLKGGADAFSRRWPHEYIKMIKAHEKQMTPRDQYDTVADPADPPSDDDRGLKGKKGKKNEAGKNAGKNRNKGARQSAFRPIVDDTNYTVTSCYDKFRYFKLPELMQPLRKQMIHPAVGLWQNNQSKWKRFLKKFGFVRYHVNSFEKDTFDPDFFHDWIQTVLKRYTNCDSRSGNKGYNMCYDISSSIDTYYAHF